MPVSSTENKKLEELVLVTLSFFELMTESKIILDFDQNKLVEHPDFHREKLEAILQALERRGLIIRVTIGQEVAWKRIQKKKTWPQKIRYFILQLFN